MSDPSADSPDDPDEPGSKLDAALGAFKPRAPDADTSRVSDSGRPRMNWDPVTDSGGGGTTDTQPRSSFQFDLGSALARLSGAVDSSSLATEAATTDEDAADEPPSPSHDGEVRVSSPDRGVGEVPESLPVRGVGEVPESLPVRGRSDEPEAADPLPVRGVGEVPESLPVRGVGEVRESLPVRGRSDEPEAADPLPVRGRSGGSEATDPLPVRGEPRRDAGDPIEPLPTRTSGPGPEATHSPVVDPLPTRSPRPVEPVTAPDVAASPPAMRQPARKSVFDDASPAPTLPAAGAPITPVADDAPTLPTAAAVPTGMPTLPASIPAAPPPVSAPVESAPSTPELNALRSAQLRAHRNERQGKLFGRSLLAFVVLGGLVAVALVFGRSYLFPTEWTAELTPLVDELQSSREAEFDHTLNLVERPATEYGPLVTGHVLGDDWNTRLPEWRALGLAGGDGAVADVQARVAGLYPAFYDPEADELVAAAGVSPDGRAAALRLALDTALTDQLTGGSPPATSGVGLTGLDDTEAVARRAVDAAVSGVAGSAPDAVADLAGVPLPVAYQLRAIDELGDDLLASGATSPVGASLPEAASRLDAVGGQAAGALRQPGDQQVLEPVALGTDAWAMIWGTRMPPATAGRMADSLVADSYTVVSRSGVTCFLGVFETDSDVAGATLLSNLATWVGNAPEAARAAAIQLGPTRLQIEACDPGADAAVAPPVAAVDLVLQRQLDRLADG